jgi:hypothetical protein
MNTYKIPPRPKFYTHDYTAIYKFVDALEQGINTCEDLKDVGVTSPQSLLGRAKEIGYIITCSSRCITKNPFAPSKKYIKTFTLQSTPND